MLGGMRGFRNAPVTRAFIAVTCLLTVLFMVRGRSRSLGLSYQDTIRNLQLWRVITSAIIFSSNTEAMLGAYLLYYFRIFERQIGSNKYSIFILFSLLVSSILEVLALTLLRGYSSSILASGPYGLIFASFMPFYFVIPVSSFFHKFSVRFSDKSFVYFTGILLLLSSWRQSLVPALCGLLAGSLYHCNMFGICKIMIPEAITLFFSRLSSTFGNSLCTSTSNRTIITHAPSYAGRSLERIYPSADRVHISEPPVSSVATLVSMGFESSSARQALMQARNDINRATNILIQSQSN